MFTDDPGTLFCDFFSRGDTHGIELFIDTPSHSPYILNRHKCHQLSLPIDIRQINNTAGLCLLFSCVVGKFGQSFSRRNSHADKQPCFLINAFAHLLSERFEWDKIVNPDNIQKTLIN